jgi:hypothetical protein
MKGRNWPSFCCTEWKRSNLSIQGFEGGVVNRFSAEKGAIGYILMWLLGIPIPILLAIFLLRGCD